MAFNGQQNFSQLVQDNVTMPFGMASMDQADTQPHT